MTEAKLLADALRIIELRRNHGNAEYEAQADECVMRLRSAALTPPLEDPQCAGCGGKKASEGWALYCVDCATAIHVAFTPREPAWVCLEGMSKGELQAYDYGCDGMQGALERILDGKDTGEGVSYERWERLRRRVLKLVALAKEQGVQA